MNKDLLAPFRAPLIKYCKDEGLEFEKIVSLPKCGNDNALFVQYYDSEKCGKGLLNNKPAEVVIQVEKRPNGEFDILPGKNIRKYLG